MSRVHMVRDKPCKDCGVSESIMYMVNDLLWQIHGVGSDILCIRCFCKRLGRKLDRRDLLDCEANDVNKHFINYFMEGGCYEKDR